MRSALRNVAIIAHVDHGKTTLVDAILKQTGTLAQHKNVAERVMDQNDLERERGITILSKNTSVNYKNHKINIVDTPGHADFGGEVERILGMVDGALLIVDAAEGPMPQTRFVLDKAFAANLTPIVVVNKIDRGDARPEQVVDEVLDLFIELGADDDSIEFPVLYSNARDGTAGPSLKPESQKNILPVLETILNDVPPPLADLDQPLQFQVSALDYDDYVGRLAIGRTRQGLLQVGDQVVVQRSPGAEERKATISALFTYRGLERQKTDRIEAGDIGAVAGIEELTIGDTITDRDHPQPLPPIRIEPPTVRMTFVVNKSPFAGREGRYLTSRHLYERLMRETKTDVSLQVKPGENADRFIVSGRGELHLAVLIETMRREGYELAIEQPDVIEKEVNGETCEPLELLVAEIPEAATGRVLEQLGARQAEVLNLSPAGEARMRLRCEVPTRGLLGFRSTFLAVTKGEGIMHHTFERFDRKPGDIPLRDKGAMIAWETGTTTAYALEGAQQRGTLFVGPGEEVYKGQIVGECSRPQDLEINVCKKRKTSNVRSAAGEETTHLKPAEPLTLDEAITWITGGEQVEVTPEAIRLRKL